MFSHKFTRWYSGGYCCYITLLQYIRQGTVIHSLSSVPLEAVSLPMEAQLTLLLMTLGTPVGSCGCKGRKHQTSQHQWQHQTLPQAWLALSSVPREVAPLSALRRLIWDIISFFSPGCLLPPSLLQPSLFCLLNGASPTLQLDPCDPLSREMALLNPLFAKWTEIQSLHRTYRAQGLSKHHREVLFSSTSVTL